jgi:beta-lactam-binding protein with PASTA domain
VVGMSREGAVDRLAAQPLEANVAYAPAKAGRLPGIVVSQDPRAGGLSAHDSVTIWISKARQGLVPNFVGSSLEDANRELERLGLEADGVTAPGPMGVVLRQSLRPGVASAPGLEIRLVVGDGSRK